MNSKFITGKTGVGKTHLAKELLEEAKKDWPETRKKYDSFANEKEHYKFYFAPMMVLESRVPKRALEIIKEATYADFVVIDDIGNNKNSNYNPDVIYIIINNRLEKGKTTIVTSNLSVEEIGDKIDDRLASRLSTFEIVELEGDDRRISS